MPAGNYDLNIDQGADFTLLLTITQADGTTFDLTNFTFLSQIRPTYEGEIAATFECTALDLEGGILQLKLDADDTEALGDTEYRWDLVLTEMSGEAVVQVIRLLAGIVNVSPSVSREEPVP